MPKNKLSRIIVIVGPTVSGKSDLAVRIAKRVNGEVISADSRQVYRGMNIGTGKINKKEMRGVPHHLLDVVSPKSEFNVSHFKKLVTKKIEEIARPVRGRSPRGGRLPRSSPKGWYRGSRAFGRAASNGVKGHVPIIVGGTGFWIDALIYDWPIPEVGANRALRARLEKWPTARLFAKLQKLDPARAASIKDRNETNNKRRLIRALEIVLDSGQPSPKLDLVSRYDRGIKRVPTPRLLLGYKYDLPRGREAAVRGHSNIRVLKIGDKRYQVLILGIKLPQKELEKRIYKRLMKRLASGMIREVKKLHKSGVSWKRLDNLGLEYRYVSHYLRGLTGYDEMVKQLYLAIKNYAKRQMKWFKRNPQIKWVSRNANLQMRANAANQIYKQSLVLVQKFLYR